MRLAVLACFAIAAAFCGVSAPALAGKYHVKAQTYDVTGSTGAALVKSMDSKGPKYGFMTRAIAQTSYTVNWDLQVDQTGHACRLKRAVGTLNITYTFPRVGSEMTPALKPRWTRFFAGVRAHEQTHARIAREMVRVAEKSASGIKVAGDPHCARTRGEARRRISAVYAEYEARQVAFDAREHAPGGRVERLVNALLRTP